MRSRLLLLCCLVPLSAGRLRAETTHRLLSDGPDPVARELAALWSGAERRFTAVATPGPLQSLLMLSLGQGDLAVVPAEAIELLRSRKALRGVLRRIRLVAPLHAQELHFVVRRNAGLRSLADLRGRRVALGKPGSSSRIIAQALLALAGIDAGRDLQATSDEPTAALAALRAGTLDAVAGSGMAAEGLELLSPDERTGARALQSGRYVVRSRSGRRTLAAHTLLVTTDSAPPALIASLLEQLYSGLAQHPALREVSRQDGVAMLHDAPLLLHPAARAVLQRRRRFRLLTAGAGGTYDVWGRAVAAATRGARLVAVKSSGSAENLTALATGEADLALVQGDVLAMLRERGDLAPLAGAARLVAALHLEEVHVLVRRELAGGTLRDLVGRRVALGAAGSGTALTAQRLLARHHVGLAHLRASYLAPAAALEALLAGRIDACFIVGGRPYPLLARLPEGKLALLPVTLPNPGIYRQVVITRDSYGWLESDVTTLGTPCLLLASRTTPDFLVRAVLDGIYAESGRKLLREAHPKAVEATVAFSRDLLASRRDWFHPAARAWLLRRE